MTDAAWPDKPMRLNLNMLNDPAEALRRGEPLFFGAFEEAGGDPEPAPATASDMTAPRARLAQFAEWTNTTPPARLLSGEGADATFSSELLAYCAETGLSLDWVWLGDARSYALGEYNRTKRDAARPDASQADRDAAEEVMCALEKARYRWAALDIITTGVVKISPVDQFTDAQALLGVVSDLEDAIEDARRHFSAFCDRKAIQP